MGHGLGRTLVVTLVLLAVSAAYVLRISGGMADFSVYYRAGQRMAAHETIYQPSDGHYMFKYFPSAALVYVPLTALPVEGAKAVWFGLSIAALAGMFRITGSLVSASPAPYALVVSGLILAKYFLHELRLGQINILVTLVMLLGIRALDDRRGERGELQSGALTGLAIALKPYAALLLPYFVLTRRWRGAAALLSALAAALALPALFYGVDGNLSLLRQWAVELSRSTPSLLTNNDNVSVAAFFTKWRGEGQALAPTLVVLGGLAVVTTAVVLRGRGQPRAHVLDSALVLTLIPLVSPLGWDYTFLMSLLAVHLVVSSLSAFPLPVRWLLAANFAIVALATYDVLGRARYATFMQWSVTTLNFVAVVVALAYLRFRRAR
jgi:hypothetical protein